MIYTSKKLNISILSAKEWQGSVLKCPKCVGFRDRKWILVYMRIIEETIPENLEYR